MIPNERIPNNYEPGVFTRLLEDIYRKFTQLNQAIKSLGEATSFGLIQTIGELKKAVSGLRDELDLMGGKLGVALPIVKTVNCQKFWGRIIVGSFQRPPLPRVHGVHRWEWQFSQSSDFSTIEREFETFPRQSLVVYVADGLDTNPRYCRVRPVARDGSVGQWTSSANASPENLTSGAGTPDMTPPTWNNATAGLTLSGTYIGLFGKWLKLASVTLRWNKALDEGLGVQCYYLFYKLSSDGNDKWQMLRVSEAINYGQPGDYRYGTIPFLRVGSTYDFKVMAVDRAGNETNPDTDTGARLTSVTITPDTTCNSPRLSYKGVEWERGLFFVHPYAVFEVNDVEPDHAFFHVRWKRNETGAVYWGHAWPTVDTCYYDGPTEGYYTNGKHYIKVGPLLPEVAYIVEIRAVDFSGNRSAYSANSAITSSSIVLTPPQPTITSASVVPLWYGPIMRRAHYRVVTQFKIPAEYNYVRRFEIRVSRTGVAYAPTFFMTAEGVESGGYLTFENHHTLLIPPSVTTIGADSKIKVAVRSWCNGKASSWSGLTTAYVAAQDNVSGTTTLSSIQSVTMVPGMWRTIAVQIVPENFDFPNNFSHFTIHARVSSVNNPWIPDTTTYTDCICPYVSREFSTKPVWCFVPLRPIWQSSNSRAFLPSVQIPRPSSATHKDHHLCVKAVMHCFQLDAGTNIVMPKYQSHTYVGANPTGDVSEEDSPFGDGGGFVPGNAVLALTGDVIFAPSAKCRYNVVSNHATTTIALDVGVTNGYNPFNVGDIVMLAKPGSTFSSRTECMKVTNAWTQTIAGATFPYITVRRGWGGTTKETARAGDVLVKVGEVSSVYRYIWMDTVSDSMKIVATEAGSNSWIRPPFDSDNVEAEFGRKTSTIAIKIGKPSAGFMVPSSIPDGTGISISPKGIIATAAGSITASLSSETGKLWLRGGVSGGNQTTTHYQEGNLTLAPGADIYMNYDKTNPALIKFGDDYVLGYYQDSSMDKLRLGDPSPGKSVLEFFKNGTVLYGKTLGGGGRSYIYLYSDGVTISVSGYRAFVFDKDGYFQPSIGYKSSDGSGGKDATINYRKSDGTIGTLTFKDGLLTSYS